MPLLYISSNTSKKGNKKSTSPASSAATRRSPAKKSKPLLSPGKPVVKLHRLKADAVLKTKKTKVKANKAAAATPPSKRENLVTVTRSGRRATSWKQAKLEPESEPEELWDDEYEVKTLTAFYRF